MTRILTKEILEREAKRGFERFSSFLHSLECYSTQEKECSAIIDDFFVVTAEKKREIWERLAGPQPE